MLGYRQQLKDTCMMARPRICPSGNGLPGARFSMSGDAEVSARMFYAEWWPVAVDAPTTAERCIHDDWARNYPRMIFFSQSECTGLSVRVCHSGAACQNSGIETLLRE